MAPSVLVVGAGAAGMAAVRELERASVAPVAVSIFEASSRAGGRVLGVDIPVTKAGSEEGSVRVELGAEYVHGRGHELSDACTRLGVTLTPVCVAAQGDGGPSGFRESEAHVAYWCGGKWVRFSHSDDAWTEPWFARLNQHLRTFAERNGRAAANATRTVASSLPSGEAPCVRSMADAGYANTLGAGDCDLLDESETRVIEQGWDAQIAGDSVPARGMSRVLEALEACLSCGVRLNHHVHTISWDGTRGTKARVGFVASFAHPDDAGDASPEELANELLFDAVIFTGALPSLAHIDVHPPLRDDVAAAASGSRSPVGFARDAVKAAVVLRGCPWHGEGDELHAVICADEPWPEISFRRAPEAKGLWVCTGFASGTFAASLKQACIARVGAGKWRTLACDELLAQLDRLFSDGGAGWRASANLPAATPRAFTPPSARCAGAAAYDWGADAFAQGSYSYPRAPGAASVRARLNAPVWAGAGAPPFFLAGEALGDAHGAPMTLHAALASGGRAARAVLGRLGRASNRGKL